MAKKDFAWRGFELRTFRTLGLSQNDFSQFLENPTRPSLDNLFFFGIVSVKMHWAITATQAV